MVFPSRLVRLAHGESVLYTPLASCSPTVHRFYDLIVDDLTRQLSEQFGFAKFRPSQEEVIRAVLAGRVVRKS